MLNDHWVLATVVPNPAAGPPRPFACAPRNRSEGELFAAEDAHHELDVLIQGNAALLAELDELHDFLSKQASAEERLRLALGDGWPAHPHRRVLERVRRRTLPATSQQPSSHLQPPPPAATFQ